MLSTKDLLAIAKEAAPILKQHNITVAQLVATASDLVPLARQHGVTVPAEIEDYLAIAAVLTGDLKGA